MNIAVGKSYIVSHEANDCHCVCHKVDNVRHIMPCCDPSDTSYHGPAKCIQQFDRISYLFETPSLRKIKLGVNSVVREVF